MKLVGLERVIWGKWRSIQDQGSSGGLTWSIVLKSNLIWKFWRLKIWCKVAQFHKGVYRGARLNCKSDLGVIFIARSSRHSHWAQHIAARAQGCCIRTQSHFLDNWHDTRLFWMGSKARVSKMAPLFKYSSIICCVILWNQMREFLGNLEAMNWVSLSEIHKLGNTINTFGYFIHVKWLKKW